MDKELGKIESVKFGYGGYQDAMFGVTIGLRFGGCMGTVDFKGAWSSDIEVNDRTKWTEEDRSKQNDETVRFLNKIMKDANVRNITDLVGIPVEVTSEGMTMKSWRVLTEVI
jgi:hypothetical protein